MFPWFIERKDMYTKCALIHEQSKSWRDGEWMAEYDSQLFTTKYVYIVRKSVSIIVS